MPSSESESKQYWEARLERHVGIEGVGYLGLGSRYNKWLYRLREAVLRRTLRELKIDIKHMGVLDIGSGTGFYVRLWKCLGARELTASDLTEVAVRRLRDSFRDVEVIQLDIGDPSVDPDLGSFDLVSAFDVLFHIVDDSRYAQAFVNANRLLRPGGFFVFSENFLHGPTIRAPQQVSRSLEQIERVAEGAGLSILFRGPMTVLMNFPVDSRSRARKELWRWMTAPARIHDAFGGALGRLLFPIDRGLTRLLREGPTTEICVCLKRT